MSYFPALTPAQRYHYEVFGYVLVPSTVSSSGVKDLADALVNLRREVAEGSVAGVRVHENLPHHFVATHFDRYRPCIGEYLDDPWLVGMAEEICGGSVRLSHCTCVINSRASVELENAPAYDLHSGLRPSWGTRQRNGLSYTVMARTMTYLTDVGPDDGGTVLVKGSHRMDLPLGEVVACAYADRSLLHQVVAPAGSTLLFSEATVHATGQHRSDRSRIVISGVYTTTMHLPEWPDGRLHADSWEKYRSTERYRTLSQAVDDKAVSR